MAIYILDEQTTSALLGRELSKVESDNFALYAEITKERLKDLLCNELDLTPGDAKLLWARLFGVITAEQEQTTGHGITSKRVEDFYINYDLSANSPMFDFVKLNQSLINNYSHCLGASAGIRTSKTYGDRLYYI